MPYNKSYEESDEEPEAGYPYSNNPTHPEAQPRTGAPAEGENTLLQDGVETYFSDERILIPETEKVSRGVF